MTMSRFVRRASAAATGLLIAGITFVTAGAPQAAAAGHGAGFYGVWADNVSVRADSSEECDLYPGPGNCPRVIDHVNSWSVVKVFCQNGTGTVVGGNPYWLWVSTPNGIYGWMASYYVENATNRIDGLEDC
ncbi:hypothetical protein [Kribbella sp. NPDC006257]|uniref:hypothetical protein n=1 Tax=Kribbella sp. NPDC006257 TaxID=3156738 RepID=UPI0033A4A550